MLTTVSPTLPVTATSGSIPIGFKTIAALKETTISSLSPKLVSDGTLSDIETIVEVWIVLTIAAAGFASSILKLIIFTRQGFRDSINVSLTAIALWDSLKCLAGVIHRLYGPITLVSPVQGITWRNQTFPTCMYLSLFAGFVTYGLVSYVGIERCLSVAMPFKVKAVFTPRFTLVMVVLISIVVFGAFAVMLFIYDIHYLYSPEYNETIAMYEYNTLYYANETIILVYYKIAGLVLPLLSFVILCATSVTTVYYLRKSTEQLYKIRASTSGETVNSKSSIPKVSSRKKRVIRMLLVIIVVYIINIFPRLIVYVISLIEPEFYILRRYHNTFMSTVYMIFILDFSLSAINFFIFLKMSTNFKKTFCTIFPCCDMERHLLGSKGLTTNVCPARERSSTNLGGSSVSRSTARGTVSS